MYRYCPNCEEEYDFKVSGAADLDNLICPACGRKVDKNSRKPKEPANEGQTEVAIGEAILTIYNVIYSFFVITGVLGMISFLLKWDILLYICTAVSILSYMRVNKEAGKEIGKGFLGVLIGAGLGWLIFKSIQGICFGAIVVLVAYYVLRMAILALIKMVMNWSQK